MIADEDDAKAWLRTVPGCDDAAWDRLDRLTTMLVAENARQNLVSHASMEEVWRRHIADSAQLLRFVPRDTAPWIDLGAGAGFPGLVISILQPDRTTVLIENRRRRVEWLGKAIDALALSHARVVAATLDGSPPRHVPAASVISARAFAPLDRLVELSAALSTPETWWLLPKGGSARQELDALVGWRHMFHVEPSLTNPSSGIVVGRLLGREEMR